MSNKVALIETVIARISTDDLERLSFINSELGNGSNHSRSIRHLIRFASEYLAYEQHQREIEARCI